MKKSYRKSGNRKDIKGPLRLLNDMYIWAEVLLASGLAAALIIPWGVAAICLISGHGFELWLGGNLETAAESTILTAAVTMGGAFLLDYIYNSELSDK